MALTILTQPFILVHSDNPIPFEVKGGASWLGYSPTSSWGYWIQFTASSVAAGDHIVFKLYGQEIVVTILPTGATIPDSGLFVEENGSMLLDTWINTVLIPTIAQNYHINKCAFSSTPGYLFINADYESFLEVSTDIAGATATLIGVGTPDVFPENYNIICDIFVTLSGESEKKAATLAAVPSKKSPYKAVFELENVLSSFVRAQLPTFHQTTISECTSPMCMARLEFSEGYGRIALYQNVDYYTKFLVLKGGIPYQEYPSVNYTYPLFASDFWRTWQPKEKKVSQIQPEYLYFYPIYSVFYAPATITAELKGRIIYTDGTFLNVVYATHTFNRYYEYIIPTGYNQLNVGGFDPSKVVDTWAVFLYSTTMFSSPVVISPVQTYKLSSNCAKDREMFFIFENSLGCFDTLRTTTNPEVGIRINVEEFSKENTWRYKTEEGERKVNNISAAKRIKVGTGWVSIEYIKYLQEFLISPQIYHCEYDNTGSEPNGKYLPIVINSQNFALYKNDAQLYALEFEFEYQFNVDKFANKKLTH